MQTSVDDGPLFWFYRMNAFTGMQPSKSFHFHDVEKNASVERDMALYEQHSYNEFMGSCAPPILEQAARA